MMAGDDETGVTIHETVAELDAGPIAAREAFPIGDEDDAGAVFERAAEVAARLLDDVLGRAPSTFEPQVGEPTYAEKIGPDDRQLDLARPAAELVRVVRALSPHIGARAELEGRRVTVWRARVGARRELRAARGAARRREADARGGLAARPAVSAISPARRVAFTVVRRVFEDGRLRRSRAALRGRRARRPRPRARATASPTGRSSAPARSTTRSRRSGGGLSASSTRPCAPRFASARTSWPTSTAFRATQPSTSPSSSCAARGSSERCRSRTPCCGGSPTAPGAFSRACRRRRRGRRRCGTRTRTGSPRRGGASSAPDEARMLMAAQNEEPETAVRLVRGTIDGTEDPDLPGAWVVDRVDEEALAEGRVWPQSRGLAARRPRRGLGAGRADARPLRGPRAARRRCSRARSSPSSSTRRGPSSSRRTPAGSARRRCASSTRTAATCRPS